MFEVHRIKCKTFHLTGKQPQHGLVQSRDTETRVKALKVHGWFAVVMENVHSNGPVRGGVWECHSESGGD